jgi:hypothetical protein
MKQNLIYKYCTASNNLAALGLAVPKLPTPALSAPIGRPPAPVSLGGDGCDWFIIEGAQSRPLPLFCFHTENFLCAIANQDSTLRWERINYDPRMLQFSCFVEHPPILADMKDCEDASFAT